MNPMISYFNISYLYLRAYEHRLERVGGDVQRTYKNN